MVNYDSWIVNQEHARLLGHELWIGQNCDGRWRCWITGEKPVKHEGGFSTAEEAKKAVHALAHWHLEEKNFCDCQEELAWITVSSELVR